MAPSFYEKKKKYYLVFPMSVYDFIMYLGNTGVFREDLFQRLELKKTDKVLEMACGTGLNFEYYPEGPSYHATDINSRMLAKAGDRSKKELKDISLYQVDACALPFPENYFDVAVITFGL